MRTAIRGKNKRSNRQVGICGSTQAMPRRSRSASLVSITSAVRRRACQLLACCGSGCAVGVSPIVILVPLLVQDRY